jgi:SAM-dependent methyltransferase
MTMDAATLEFARAYGEHRAAEGRALSHDEMLALPWLRTGPHARQWAVRARTFELFNDRLLQPLARAKARPLAILDLGAGNGWLCHRVARQGHLAIAVDIRDDAVDGLGAADWLARQPSASFDRITASFDAIPVKDAIADISLFNASLHYAVDLPAVLREARRVTRPGGVIAVLDSPFYRKDEQGEAMVAEKRRRAKEVFGERASTLAGLDCIEFLTAGRLEQASKPLRMSWRRHRVRYPLGYELRPVAALLLGRRAPSRFDMWTAAVK